MRGVQHVRWPAFASQAARLAQRNVRAKGEARGVHGFIDRLRALSGRTAHIIDIHVVKAGAASQMRMPHDAQQETCLFDVQLLPMCKISLSDHCFHVVIARGCSKSASTIEALCSSAITPRVHCRKATARSPFARRLWALLGFARHFADSNEQPQCCGTAVTRAQKKQPLAFSGGAA